MTQRLALRVLLPLLALVAQAPHSVAGDAIDASAERIYRQGILPSGQPLRAQRESGGSIEGAAAACVNCHRRSGLGSAEGRFVVPPITGQYLFRPDGARMDDVDYRYGLAYQPDFSPYTDATLARAIRDGIGRDGRKLNALMPRFELDAEAMASLTAYLRALSGTPEPGVGREVLHFATVITPDADPLKKKAMLQVMETFFTDKNSFIRGGVRPMRTAKALPFRVTRRWALHVWQLEGPADSWERQLQERMDAEPVFAIVSGLGGKNWNPVHRFCERNAVPCLFPNIELPVIAENDFYNVYYSKEVLLEAQMIAFRLKNEARKPKRIIQLFRDDDIGRRAAEQLQGALSSAGMRSEMRAVGGPDGGVALAQGLAGLTAADAVVLWLRPQDLAKLPAPAEGATIFVSGLMGGLEHAPLPAAWRTRALLAYPFDLPDKRQVRMNFPLGWFAVRHIPVVDERIQSDTYLACRILSETVTEMLESFRRDYLLEQIEDMLSRRLVNGYYPRLGLAQGQRFASKGGYLVRFAAPQGDRLVADGDWIVP